MSPLYEEGRFIGVLEIFKDVSNVVHCIVEAERQRTYKETILNSIVEAILVLDPEGKVVEHNKVASRMLCREEGESLVGRHIKDLINLSLEELPPEGERADIFVETPCGRQKASLLMSPMSSGFGYVVSLYVLKDIVLCELEEESIITRSPAFQKVLDTAKTVSEYDVNILIEGETGTGKSLLAKYIHYLSPRRDGPLIRRLLHMGRLEEASIYLGRNYSIKRRVIKGDGRGSSLGFPTANLENTEDLCLKEGVYAVKVEDNFMGVANYGRRPTFDGSKKVLEVHILDFQGNLKEKHIKVEFLQFLREEKKFNNPQELIKQIEEDILRARSLFS